MSIGLTALTPVRQVLVNGVRVLVKQTSVTPAVTIQITTHVGCASDPPALPGLAYFLSRMLDRGTESMTAGVIAETLEGRGVSLVTSLSGSVGTRLLLETKVQTSGETRPRTPWDT